MHHRNAWVDYAKAIGIVLVVYGHVARGLFNAGLTMDGRLYKLVDSMIYSFHMPLFFFLAGLFFYGSLLKRGKTGLILNKVDTVLYAYILWSLLQGGVEVLLSNYTNGSATVSDVLSLAWRPRAQFWFLYALFLVFVVCTFVYGQARRRYFLPLTLLFAALYLSDHFLPPNRIAGFLLGNAVFFALGIWFNEIKVAFEAQRVWLAVLFSGLFLVGQYLFHITFGLNYEVGGWPTLGLAIISIFFMVAISMCLEQIRLPWLLLLGTSSMTIYLMHILAGSGARVILGKIWGAESVAIHLLLGTVSGLVIPLLAQVVIKRCKLNWLLAPPKWLSAERFRRRETSSA